MKVAKYISGSTQYTIEKILDEYRLVADDFDFSGNEMVDVTSFMTLSVFYGNGNINYKVYKTSLINNVLPTFDVLSLEDKKNLLYNRVAPSGYTKTDYMNIIGSEDEYDYIFNNVSDFELIEDVDNKKIDKITGTIGNLVYIDNKGQVQDAGITIDSLTGGTGFYIYGETDIQQNTTSTTPVEYLTTGGTLSGGIFSLDYIGVIGNTAKSKIVYVQFYLDGAPISTVYSYSPPDNNGVLPIHYLKDVYLSSGVHTFSIYFYSGSGTAIIQRGVIRVRKVN